MLKKLTFFNMPYCAFCGKVCPTVPGLNRHIDKTPNCKKASHEEFGQYANGIWDDIPENLHNKEWQQLLNLQIEPDLPDLRLEEDIQIAEEIFNSEEANVPMPQPTLPPQRDEPQLHPQHATVGDGCRYIENFPEEYLAGATWGTCKPLYEHLDEDRKKEGASRWSPFEDEDEWQLAEWLIKNVGQRQTDLFLKLPIVSFILSCFRD